MVHADAQGRNPVKVAIIIVLDKLFNECHVKNLVQVQDRLAILIHAALLCQPFQDIPVALDLAGVVAAGTDVHPVLALHAGLRYVAVIAQLEFLGQQAQLAIVLEIRKESLAPVRLKADLGIVVFGHGRHGLVEDIHPALWPANIPCHNKVIRP